MNSETYCNVYRQEGETPSFCYRTGRTVYEEVFRNSSLIVGGWNAAGYPLNVLGSSHTRVNPNSFAQNSSFRLNIDGESCDYGLTLTDFRSFEEDDHHVHAVITLRKEEKDLTVRVHTVLDGTACFTRYLELTNTGDKALSVSKLSVMSGAIEEMDLNRYTSGSDIESFYELGYMDADDGCMEGDFSWHRLTPDEHSFGGRFSRSRHRHPMFLLKNKLRGTMMIGQFAYSGGYKFSFDYRAHPFRRNTGLSFETGLDSLCPVYVLNPGETWVTPAFHVGMVQGGLDEAVNAMNHHIRRSVFTLKEANNRACTVGSGMGPEHDMSLETTKNFIDQMAACGAEVFIIDAGWYCPPGLEGSDWWTRAGNWFADKDRYPNTLKEVSDYAESKGMALGLWMEVERIGQYSGIYEEHKDWFTTHSDGTKSNGFLDMTNPEVLKWCEEQVAHVIRDYHIKLFRVDYNIGSNELFHIAENNGIRECRAVRHCDGFYTLYRNLKKRFPDVIFENCAGGGGRTDLGMVSNFMHTWVSDNQVPPRSALITNGMTMALPPESVDRLVAGMGCHTIASLDFHMRNAMLTHISLNAFGQKDCEMNPEVIGFIRHSVDLYKSFIRPFLPDCNVYHHTPDTREALKQGYLVLEDAAQDGSRGVIGIFSMPDARSDTTTVYPRGITGEKTYRVYFDNTGANAVVSGFQMMQQGLRIRIPASMSSELVTYEEIKTSDTI